MNVKIKNMPRLALAKLLKRRKMSLDDFIEESGIQTYAALVNRCSRMGVIPPSEREYKLVRPEIVNSPSDGVIVLEPIEILEDDSDETDDDECDATFNTETVPVSQEKTQKRRRKKKKVTIDQDEERSE